MRGLLARLQTGDAGQRRIAVNPRLAEREALTTIPIDAIERRAPRSLRPLRRVLDFIETNLAGC